MNHTAMSHTIQIAGPVAAPTPGEFASYLRVAGWQARNGDAHWLEFSHPDLPSDAVLRVPEFLEAPDYARRAAILLDDLARRERRPALEVLQSIHASSRDTLQFRLQGPQLDDGRASVQAAHRAHQAIREVLLSAARSSDRPQASYEGRPAERVLAPLRQLRFAPARAGSYVLTVEAPATPRLTASADGVAEPATTSLRSEPATRRAILAVTAALHAAETATRRAQASAAVEPFFEQVRHGVSANLCRALAALLTETEATSIHTTTRFADCRPAPAGIPRESTFRAEDAPLLREAAAGLTRAATEEPHHVLTGLVTELHSDSPAAGGDAMVTPLAGPSRRGVRVELRPEDYPLAVEAHLQGKALRCAGRLLREGRQRWLREVVTVEVVGPTGEHS